MGGGEKGGRKSGVVRKGMYGEREDEAREGGHLFSHSRYMDTWAWASRNACKMGLTGRCPYVCWQCGTSWMRDVVRTVT